MMLFHILNTRKSLLERRPSPRQLSPQKPPPSHPGLLTTSGTNSTAEHHKLRFMENNHCNSRLIIIKITNIKQCTTCYRFNIKDFFFLLDKKLTLQSPHCAPPPTGLFHKIARHLLNCPVCVCVAVLSIFRTCHQDQIFFPLEYPPRVH